MSREATFFSITRGATFDNEGKTTRLISRPMSNVEKSDGNRQLLSKNVRFPPMRLCALLFWYTVILVPPHRHIVLTSGATLTRIYSRDLAVLPRLSRDSASWLCDTSMCCRLLLGRRVSPARTSSALHVMHVMCKEFSATHEGSKSLHRVLEYPGIEPS